MKVHNKRENAKVHNKREKAKVHYKREKAKIVYIKVPDNYDKQIDVLLESTVNLPPPKKL